jgi:hypothetical protein
MAFDSSGGYGRHKAMKTDEILATTKPPKLPKAKGPMPRKRGGSHAEEGESSNSLRPGQGIREFLELVHGEPIAPDTTLLQLLQMMRQVEFTEDLVKLLAGCGIATNYALTLRGNRWTAEKLVDLLGTTDKSFSEKVKDLELDEAREMMTRLCKEAGISPAIAKQMVAAAESKK